MTSIRPIDPPSADVVRGEVYEYGAGRFRLGYRYNFVIWSIDGGDVTLTTPVAIEIGKRLCMLADEAEREPGALVALKVNGRRIKLLPSVARQIGGVTMKKADRADDWQRANGGARA